MKPEKSLAIVGGGVGLVMGCVVGLAAVSMAEKIAALKPWQKALVVVGLAGTTGVVSAAALYAMYGPMTAALRH